MTTRWQIASLADDRGATLVMFAVFSPVLILLAVFAIDTSNWFLHSRHLQVQADAGVLAAAQGFQSCFTNASAANTAITAQAAQYAGIAGSPLYNPQLGGTAPANVHEQLNSKTYYKQSSPVDSSAVEKPPCEAEMVDVKLTETRLPWYWHPASRVANINAHARVEILQETRGTGLAPLAVAETAPVAAAAYFVDEDNNDAILAKETLTKLFTSEGLDRWASSAAPVTINHPHIGVVIALSGKLSDTTCGDAYVQCFDESTTTGPSLVHIQGWSSAGSGTGSYKAPIVREVTLQGGTCSDPYFAASGKGCSIGVTAKVDLGATPNPPGVEVSAIVGGGGAVALKYSSTSKTWSVLSTPGVTLPKEGSNRVDLRVTCNPKVTGAPCTGTKVTSTTVEDVQRTYAAGEGSGTIKGAWISEPGAKEPVPGSQDADSYEQCATCTHKLAVSVDVGGSIGNAAGYADPLRKLRFEGEQGVRAGCPPTEGPSAKRYEEHLAKGCPGQYTINASDPTCTANSSPYDCLRIGLTGKDTGPTRKGIDTRIKEEPPPGTQFYCENNWKNNNGGGVPIIPSSDSRLIQIFIIPYGTVDSEGRSLLGNEEVPIQDFATFYATGFPGDAEKFCPSDPKTGNAEVVGHFVKYVNTVNNGGGEEKCVANSLGECVAVLTR
jgi:hypothetical protein